MRRVRRIVLAWVVLLLGALPLCAADGAPARLEVGARLLLDVPGARGAVFELEAPANGYVEIAAGRWYGDLQLTLEGPGGAVLATAALDQDTGSAARLAAVTTVAGRHVLRVTSRDVPEPKPSAYELSLVALRPAGPGDVQRGALHARLGAARIAFRKAGTDDERRAQVAEFRKIAVEFRTLGIHDGAAVAFKHVFDAANDLGDMAAVREAAEAARDAWRAAGDRLEEGRAQSELGYAAYAAFDKKALEFLEAALALHEETADAAWIPETLRRIGWYWRWQGDRTRALECYARALPLWARTRNWQGEIGTLGDIGLAHKELEEISTALDDYERALALAVPGRDDARVATLLVRTGAIYQATGEYDRAIAVYQRAIAATAAVRDRRSECAAHYNLGLVFGTIGDRESEQAAYRVALDLARQVQLKNGIAVSLRGLSNASRDLGDLEAAERYGREALDAAVAAGSAMEEAFVRLEMSALALGRGDGAEAIRQAEATRDLAAKGGLRRMQSSALLLLAITHDRAGRRDQALEDANAALALIREMGAAPELEARTLALRCRLKLDAGDREGALADVRDAVRLRESLRRKFVHPERQSIYVATRHDVLALEIDALLAGDPAAHGPADLDAALEAAESARARSLLDLLAESRVDLRAGVDPGLLARERALRRSVNYKASELDRILDGKIDKTKVAALAKDLDALTLKLKDVEAEIRAASPHFASLTQPEPLSAAAIRDTVLDDDTVLFEFVLGDERSWLLAATRSGITAHELPARGALEPLARTVYENTTARQAAATVRGESVARADRAARDASATLSRLLLGPVAERLSGVWKRKRLALVAPDALGIVPFAALPVPGTTRPLVADHEIVSLPSASVLAEVRREAAARPAPAHTIAVLADPVFESDDPRLLKAVAAAAGKEKVVAAVAAGAAIARSTTRARFTRLPFSRDEARAIRDLVPPGQLLELTGFDADLARVTRGDLATYRIVHFATHGVLHAERPELSGLALSLYGSDGRPRDGFLRLGDVYNLHLPANLAVLSACQTALGRDVRGEGLVGLTRGFMYAGVPRVVATLWKVDDAATAEFMRLFYRALLQDKLRPAAALRAAQTGLAKNPEWAAPWYWAGFVLQGDWS